MAAPRGVKTISAEIAAVFQERTALEKIFNEDAEKEAKRRGVAPEIDENAVKNLNYQFEDITDSGTHIEVSDLRLMCLAFKKLLPSSTYNPLADSLNTEKVLYAYATFGDTNNRMTDAERDTLARENKLILPVLKEMAKSTKPISTVLTIKGMDSEDKGHYITVNFNPGKPYKITIEDTFTTEVYMPEEKKGHSSVREIYEKRLNKLFNKLLGFDVELKANPDIPEQTAANCGIHAVINKINYEYGTKFIAEAMSKDLRKALDDAYKNKNTDQLSLVIGNAIKEQQRLGLLTAQPAVAARAGGDREVKEVKREVKATATPKVAAPPRASAASSVSPGSVARVSPAPARKEEKKQSPPGVTPVESAVAKKPKTPQLSATAQALSGLGLSVSVRPERKREEKKDETVKPPVQKQSKKPTLAQEIDMLHRLYERAFAAIEKYNPSTETKHSALLYLFGENQDTNFPEKLRETLQTHRAKIISKIDDLNKNASSPKDRSAIEEALKEPKILADALISTGYRH